MKPPRKQQTEDWFDKDATAIQDPDLVLEIDGQKITADDLANAYDESAARAGRESEYAKADKKAKTGSETDPAGELPTE